MYVFFKTQNGINSPLREVLTLRQAKESRGGVRKMAGGHLLSHALCGVSVWLS